MDNIVTIEGTVFNVGIDVANGRDYTPCSCPNPNGFEFVEYGPGYQIWKHLKCGGQVKRPLIRT